MVYGRIVAWLPAAVITCVVEYVIDPAKIDAFERSPGGGWSWSTGMAAAAMATSCLLKAQVTRRWPVQLPEPGRVRAISRVGCQKSACSVTCGNGQASRTAS
jgi:hypothetical protein